MKGGYLLLVDALIRSRPLPVLTRTFQFSIFNLAFLLMQLVVLGSGTSVFHPQRAAAGFWLQTEAGSILLDCSADAPHRMAQEDLDLPHLDAILIMPLPFDHRSGL